MARCFGDDDVLLAAYHDEEWARPVTDERGLFERFCLEAFQSGLSWRTVLRKREAFRAAFAEFEPAAVAVFGEDDVERLMTDTGIIRNRAKIEAAIAGARATLALHESGGSLHELLLRHAPPAERPAPATMAEIPSQTPESVALAADLKRLGFRFVGPTTAYATMQAVGIVNDHLAGCPIGDRLRRGEDRPPRQEDVGPPQDSRSDRGEGLADPLLRDGDRSAEMLGEEADPQLLQQPADLLEVSRARRVRRAGRDRGLG
jgi:DNA-3-methyladenine glycosylase I